MTRGVIWREIKDFPATVTFCTIWIVVFVALCADRLGEPAPQTWTSWLLTGVGGGHRFGDLSLRDIREGEIWRVITSTFVHYSLLHIVLNLIAMYQLGTLVESWYRPSLFVFIYALIASAGNLLAALAKAWAGSDPRVHSGGGSVVIIGLVGLGAVAGWRSGTKTGALLCRLMVVILVLTAILGLALPRYLDNWGHAGGAIAGALVGLGHRAFLRGVSRPWAWGAGVLSALVMLGCAAAQVLDDRLEAPARQEARLLQRRDELKRRARGLAVAARLARQGGDSKVILSLLDLAANELTESVPTELEALRTIAASARNRALSPSEVQALGTGIGAALREVRDESLANRRRLDQLRRTPSFLRMRRPQSTGPHASSKSAPWRGLPWWFRRARTKSAIEVTR
jgi:membrane associated rhomboid family serine protease